MGRFRDALAGPGFAAIAEVKRRSPSMGDLRPDADPAAIAAAYERAGAAAVSILVDAERFGGSWDDLRAARGPRRCRCSRRASSRPTRTSRTAAEAGADAILLILRDLDDDACRRLMAGAAELGLDAFVEAHDAGELARAVALGADPIGDQRARPLDLRDRPAPPARARRLRPPRGRRSRRRRRERHLEPRAGRRRPSSPAPTRSSSARRS